VNLSAPELLNEGHDLSEFDCGVESLNEWLKRRALRNQVSGASRTFVVCNGSEVAAYYALAAGTVMVNATAGRLRRNMPDPIPVVLLGRLAVGLAYQKAGLGRAMLRDAGLRITQAAESIGIRGIVVHAISQEARAFYERIGFDPSPLDSMTLMIALSDLRGLGL
jgi:GNAT superfamily N-acetyltransferase